MNRQSALIISTIFFLVFTFTTYFGVYVSLWSSIVFAVFVSLILLNLFYPPSNAASDSADISLVLYVIYEIVGVIIIAIYIAQKSLCDVRIDYTPPN